MERKWRLSLYFALYLRACLLSLRILLIFENQFIFETILSHRRLFLIFFMFSLFFIVFKLMTFHTMRFPDEFAELDSIFLLGVSSTEEITLWACQVNNVIRTLIDLELALIPRVKFIYQSWLHFFLRWEPYHFSNQLDLILWFENLSWFLQTNTFREFSWTYFVKLRERLTLIRILLEGLVLLFGYQVYLSFYGFCLSLALPWAFELTLVVWSFSLFSLICLSLWELWETTFLIVFLVCLSFFSFRTLIIALSFWVLPSLSFLSRICCLMFALWASCLHLGLSHDHWALSSIGNHFFLLKSIWSVTWETLTIS